MMPPGSGSETRSTARRSFIGSQGGGADECTVPVSAGSGDKVPRLHAPLPPLDGSTSPAALRATAPPLVSAVPACSRSDSALSEALQDGISADTLVGAVGNNHHIKTAFITNEAYSNSAIADQNDSRLNLVAVSSRAALFNQRHFYKKVSIVFLLLILILLIAVVITTYYYVHWYKKYRLMPDLCTTDDCLRSAANLRLSMDPTADPCEDFYQFTCGRWTKEHPNHGWYPKFSNFEVIDERIMIATIEFFELSPSEETEPLPVRQSREFYQSCLDTDTTDSLGYSVIYKILREVKLPELPNYFTLAESELDNFKMDWIVPMTLMQKIIGLDSIVQFSIEADIYNRSNYVMYIGSSIGSSPLPSPLKKSHKLGSRSRYSKNLNIFASDESDDEAEDHRAKVKAAYKATMTKVVTELVANKSGNLEKVNSAVGFIFNITQDINELAATNASQEIEIMAISVVQLQNMTEEFLILKGMNPKLATNVWKKYLTFMFSDVDNVTLDFETDMLHLSPMELPYLLTVIYYLVKTPDYVKELYLWWSAVHAMIISTTNEIIEYLNKQAVLFYTRTNVPVRSRKLDCAELAINFMGIAVSYGIADKDFLESSKPKVEQMLSDIKTAFEVRVKKLSWMDEDTKKATLDKSDEMVSFIGFPDWLMNRTVIEEYYSNITISNHTFLENMINIIKSYTPSILGNLRNENERTWRTDPTTVNAYNYFGDNSINVPMAILSFPIYHLGLEVLNYGSIGSILGHELTHGFDNTGRRFDKFGNFKEWWSEHMIETFENKSECFVNQYENFTVPVINQNVNGKLTLGENLADNGGIHHAFQAYRTFLRKYGREKTLPGFAQYTNEQMFFIAFGSIWCETRSATDLLEQIQFDEHCPSSLRVLGTLQNSEDFARVFRCRKGTKMNPDHKKCRIW